MGVWVLIGIGVFVLVVVVVAIGGYPKDGSF